MLSRSLAVLSFAFVLPMLAIATLAQPRPQLVIDCRAGGDGSKLQLDGVFFELASQGYRGRLDGAEVSLERASDGARIPLGSLEEEDDARACSQSSSLVELYAPLSLSGALKVSKEISAGTCTPYVTGLPYTGYSVDWKRDVSARYVLSAGGERAVLKARAEFHYSTLEDCRNDPRVK